MPQVSVQWTKPVYSLCAAIPFICSVCGRAPAHTLLRTLGEWVYSSHSLRTPCLESQGQALLTWSSFWAYTLLRVETRSSEAASGPGTTPRGLPGRLRRQGSTCGAEEKHSHLCLCGTAALEQHGRQAASTSEHHPCRPPKPLVSSQPKCRSAPYSTPYTCRSRNMGCLPPFLRWCPVPRALPLGHNQDSGTGRGTAEGVKAQRPCACFLTAQGPCPPSAALPTTTAHTSHRTRAGWITYLKFTVFLSLFGSLFYTRTATNEKSKHFRWRGTLKGTLHQWTSDI